MLHGEGAVVGHGHAAAAGAPTEGLGTGDDDLRAGERLAVAAARHALDAAAARQDDAHVDRVRLALDLGGRPAGGEGGVARGDVELPGRRARDLERAGAVRLGDELVRARRSGLEAHGRAGYGLARAVDDRAAHGAGRSQAYGADVGRLSGGDDAARRGLAMLRRTGPNHVAPGPQVAQGEAAASLVGGGYPVAAVLARRLRLSEERRAVDGLALRVHDRAHQGAAGVEHELDVVRAGGDALPQRRIARRRDLERQVARRQAAERKRAVPVAHRRWRSRPRAAAPEGQHRRSADWRAVAGAHDTADAEAGLEHDVAEVGAARARVDCGVERARRVAGRERLHAERPHGYRAEHEASVRSRLGLHQVVERHVEDALIDLGDTGAALERPLARIDQSARDEAPLGEREVECALAAILHAGARDRGGTRALACHHGVAAGPEAVEGEAAGGVGALGERPVLGRDLAEGTHDRPADGLSGLVVHRAQERCAGEQEQLDRVAGTDGAEPTVADPGSRGLDRGRGGAQSLEAEPAARVGGRVDAIGDGIPAIHGHPEQARHHPHAGAADGIARQTVPHDAGDDAARLEANDERRAVGDAREPPRRKAAGLDRDFPRQAREAVDPHAASFVRSALAAHGHRTAAAAHDHERAGDGLAARVQDGHVEGGRRRWARGGRLRRGRAPLGDGRPEEESECRVRSVCGARGEGPHTTSRGSGAKLIRGRMARQRPCRSARRLTREGPGLSAASSGPRPHRHSQD